MDKQDHNPKIGLLGGSFNPAHAAHLEISLSALDLLGLDQLWWLVSPGNPLKDPAEMAPYQDRLKSAKEMAKDGRILVSDLEKELGTRYTADTLSKIVDQYPNHHFVWLMGADNLAQFDQWKEWRKIASTVPFAIFNRPSYSSASMTSVAATELGKYRIDEKDARELCHMSPPVWVYCGGNKNPLSSTEIRNKIK